MNLAEVTWLIDTPEPVEKALAAHMGGPGRVRAGWARAQPLPHAVLSLFALPPDTPIAPLRYLGDGGATEGLRACADPVHLAVRGDGLAILPLRLALTADDVAGFRAVLAEIFPAADAHPVCVADRGYVGGDCLADTEFTPLAMAHSRDLKPVLPAGPTGPQWRRRMTEAQMLLHGAPFNAMRAARGAPEINGVWFWGAGRLPATTATAFVRVWSDEPLTRGLAIHAGIAHAPPPADVSAWLRQLAPGRHLWVMAGADGATPMPDSASRSLLQALADEEIAGLNIVTAGRLLELTPRDVRPWYRHLWRRRARSTP